MRTNFISKTMAAVACCVLSVAAFTACDNDDDKQGDIKFDPTTVEVAPDKTSTVTIKNGTTPFTVASSNEKVTTATVKDNTVTITGVKEGSAYITVKDKALLAGKIPVLVTKNPNGLTFDKTSASMAVGKTDAVSVKNGTKPFTATSGDTKIATCSVKDNKVTIKGVKVGTTTVTVTDKSKRTGTINVTVK